MTAAAGTLGYTPSAVSQQIARLERDARQVLIERRGRTVTLTDAGRIMAESAGRVINELEAMSAQLHANSATVRGETEGGGVRDRGPRVVAGGGPRPDPERTPS